MYRLHFSVAAAIVVLIPVACQADLPDHEFQDKVQIQLRKLHLIPFPVYSQVPNKGLVDPNDGKVCWGGSTRVYMPPGQYQRSGNNSVDGLFVEKLQIRGWTSDGSFDPIPKMAFINVGWSIVTAGSESLRKGDYVVYVQGGFIKGTLRAPERERVEPRDTNREKASELLSEAFFDVNLKNYERARQTFKTIIVDYPETPSADRAHIALTSLGENGPVKGTGLTPVSAEAPQSIFVKSDGQSDGEAAEYLLNVAKTYWQLKQPSKSKQVLLGLIDKYPNTKAAERGVKVLLALASEKHD